MPRHADCEWDKNKKYLEEGFKDLKKDVRKLSENVNDRLMSISTEIAILKSENKHTARNWALAAGVLSSLAVIAIWHFLSKGQ